MSRQWRELCEKRPDLYLYQPSDQDLWWLDQERQYIEEQWMRDDMAQREYHSWLEVLNQQHGR